MNPIKTGLVSVTFRKLPAATIVDLVRQAGLDAIEWGGDIHVPHGDLAAARAARELSNAAGVGVAAYGSYYRVGHEGENGPLFKDVLDTARELGAPLIRVWAGRQGSATADAAYRRRVVEDSLRIADLAAARDIGVAWEYHGNTLTDTLASTLNLLSAAEHPNLHTLWQPIAGESVEQGTSALRQLLPRLANVHVFHWIGVPAQRRPLAEGLEIWRAYREVLRGGTRPSHLLLEFVRGDDPQQFLADAAELRKLI